MSLKKKFTGRDTTRVQLCGTAAKAIEIGGQVFTPDAATAYMEFFMAHSFPVYLDNANPGERADFTTLHPQVVANSHRSLVGKPVNLAHLMRAYNPDEIVRDRIMGTVMAVEFPGLPDGQKRWTVQGDPAAAPGIRVVAALHKNAEGVAGVLQTWEENRTLFNNERWTVSMENEADLARGGFLVKVGEGGTGYYDLRNVLAKAIADTPEDFAALGWCYVPYADAPAQLLACLKEGDYVGLKSDYAGCPTLFLNGGLDGKIFFFGVALTPAGKESAAHIVRMVSDQGHVEVGPAFDAVRAFAEAFTQ